MTAPAAEQGGDSSGADDESSGAPPESREERLRRREHRRRRFRRHGRRAYIRSVYFLPSMATLGNAICGFGAMYVASLPAMASPDRLTNFFSAPEHRFIVAAYLIFAAMVFDALDGRLARFARHTTDFGGQLDSLADVISFGLAPAFVALLLFKHAHLGVPPSVGRFVWAIGALYMSCAAIRLARFNVSNEHGEQHHFSFLGLPSPGAGGTVAAWILMQQDLAHEHVELLNSNLPRLAWIVGKLSGACVWLLPVIVLMSGLLMISNIRYPHLVNRYLRGKRSFGRLIFVLIVVLLLVVAHQYVAALGTMVYMLWGATSALVRLRRRTPSAPPSA